MKKRRGQRGMGNLYEHRRNWWLDVRIDGKRHRVKLAPCKLFEKREARKIADARVKQLMEPKPPAAKGDILFKDFAQKFADHYVKTRKSWMKMAGRTLDHTPLQHCVRFFGEKPLREITEALVEDFRAHLGQRKVGKYLRRPLTVTTANKNISLLRAVFYRAMQTGDADRNPVAELPKGKKLAKETPTAGRILEHDEQPKLFDALPAWLRMMAIFCMQTATRRGDLVQLTWKAVHPTYVEFLETKECKKRVIQLNRDAQYILEMLRPEKPDPNGYVFEPKLPRVTLEWKIARAWGKAVKRAAIPHIRFHDLRHTALTRLVANGEDLQTVKKIAGHASLNTTQRYLHSNDKQQRHAVETLAGSFGRYLPSAPEIAVDEVAVTATIH